MARVGYIMSFKHLEEDLKADIQWMNDHGCCKIFIEDEHNEAMRIVWKDMLECLACGDEIVISKFSHAIRVHLSLPTKRTIFQWGKPCAFFK